MVIPEHVRIQFSKPTLVVVADSQHADLWEVHNDTMTELDPYELLPTRKTDNETSFVNPNHGGASGPEPHDEERLKTFTKEIAHRITQHPAVHIHLVMPTHIMAMVEHHLTAEQQKRIQKRLPHNLIILTPHAILERLSQEIAPIQ